MGRVCGGFNGAVNRHVGLWKHKPLTTVFSGNSVHTFSVELFPVLHPVTVCGAQGGYCLLFAVLEGHMAEVYQGRWCFYLLWQRWCFQNVCLTRAAESFFFFFLFPGRESKASMGKLRPGGHTLSFSIVIELLLLTSDGLTSSPPMLHPKHFLWFHVEGWF